jgi:N-succinyldiaminopimelate aminotransferase
VSAARKGLDPTAARVRGMPETVFARYARLAVTSGAVNLGQGFPDDPPAPEILAAFARAAGGGHQYAPRAGLPELRAAIAMQAGRRLGRRIDPDTEVHVTVGATEALYAAIHALVDPGDEVVVIEPCYDAYPHMVRLAGGVPLPVPMEAAPDGRWRLDPERLAGALTPKTRAVLLNDPHNPTGAVLSAAAIAGVVAAVRETDAWLIVDEVYEHLAFVPTTPAAALAPERTLLIGSAGKTFGVTGWKIGWLVGPAPAVEAVAALRQWISYAVATPLQAAVAELLGGIGQGGAIDAALAHQRAGLARRRDTLLVGLREAGAAPTIPDAGYFVFADVAAWGFGDDVALCDVLPERAGVVAIPGSAFRVRPAAAAPTWLRFAFCRGDETVAEGARRLARLRPRR